MGVITCVLRDVAGNQIPAVFQDNRLYVGYALLGGWVYEGLWEIGAPDSLALASPGCAAWHYGATGSCQH